MAKDGGNFDDLINLFEDVQDKLDKIQEQHEQKRENIEKTYRTRRKRFLDEEEKEIEIRSKYLSRFITDQFNNIRKEASTPGEIFSIELDRQETIKNATEELKKNYEKLTAAKNKILELDKEIVILEQEQIKAQSLGDKEKEIFYEQQKNQAVKERVELERKIALDKLLSEQKLSVFQRRALADLQKQKEEIEKDQEKSEEEKEKEINKINNKMSFISGGQIPGNQTGPINNILNLAGGEDASAGGLIDGLVNKGISALTNSSSGFLSTIGSSLGSALSGPLGMIVQGISKVFSMLQERMEKAIDEAVDTYATYMGEVNTRLYGSESDFYDIMETLVDNATLSIYLNQKEYTKNMARLVEKGIAYNIEERAMIMTLSDRMVRTFDLLDDNLTRLIRLQQADITKQQLGAEASINEFLNRNYSDTSYLSDKYDSVTSTLLEATSQMNVDQATSFSYAVNKWLGALYSVGASGEAINTIAQGLTYLSTGDISQLQGNDSLNTLMAMAAEKAGQSYASILVNGLNGDMVDELMRAMVIYLGEIAENTSNQVLKSEWADILHVTMSDLRAFSNLTEEDVSLLYNTKNLTYEDAFNEFATQLDLVSDRTTIAQQIENLTDNIWFTFGKNMVDTDGQYLAYAISKMVDNMAEQFKGTAFGPIAKVVDIIADIGSGITEAWAMVETIQDAIQSLKSGKIINSDNLGSWNGVAMLSRGENYLGISPANIVGAETDLNNSYFDRYAAVTRSLSSSSVISMPASTTGAVGSEIENFDNVEQAVKETAQEISSVSEETTETLDKLYDMLFESQSKPIKISIENASDDFLKVLNLLINNNINLLSNDIESYLNNSNFVDQLTNTLYSVRGM